MPRVKALVEQKTTIDKIIDERGSVYGSFSSNATMSQKIKNVMRGPGWERLQPMHQEALDQIALKISRIVTGNDANHLDNWDDLAGYAIRIARTIRGEK